MLELLERCHGIKISKRTLFNHLKMYGLCRRERAIDEQIVRKYITRELDSSGSLLGYRSMWRRLHSKYGINGPRLIVQVLLAELDPEGTQHRKAHRLKRRQYSNPGPNFCWQCLHLIFSYIITSIELKEICYRKDHVLSKDLMYIPTTSPQLRNRN